jgi:excisionase family DNA binding protein
MVHAETLNVMECSLMLSDDQRSRDAFSIREAAARLGVSVQLLFKLRRQGKTSFVKLGNRSLITAEELARLLKREDS